MIKRLVLVAGNIGTGKTSLTERIGARLGWKTAFESVADNPYLADFYGDMAQWAFHLQVFFLGHRARQHQELARCPESAISDRSIYEDAHIFSRAAHHLGNMNERDYGAYRAVYDLVIEGVTASGLVAVSESAGAGVARPHPPTRPRHREWRHGGVPVLVGELLRRVDGDLLSVPGASDPHRGARFRTQAATPGHRGYSHPGSAGRERGRRLPGELKRALSQWCGTHDTRD